MPTLLFFPLLPFLLEVGLVIYFVFTSAMLYSAGDLVPKLKTELDDPILDLEDRFPVAAPETAPDASLTSLPNEITREECAANPSCYYGVEWNDTLKYMFLYHLFGLLWTNQFIIGLGYVAIAGAVANFYWCRGDTSSENLSPVKRSIWNTFRYHLGTPSPLSPPLNALVLPQGLLLLDRSSWQSSSSSV